MAFFKKTKMVFRGAGRLGQSVLEYAILVSIVAAAVMAMTLYVRRAIQGKLYQMDERITVQSLAPTSITYVPPN
jgi:Flp pilus assembly pilin Flp